MGRNKRYENAAERQRAYRLRFMNKQKQSTGPPLKLRRPLSRQTRITSVEAQVQQLHDEYEHWLASLPEAVQGGELADRLNETVEQLSTILELLGELNPPRGFGRD
jgi:hypothetical protein